MISRTIAIATAVFGLVAVAVMAPVVPAQAEDSLRTSGVFYDVRSGEYVSIDGKKLGSGTQTSMAK